MMCISSACATFKTVFSTCLLVFSCVLVIALMFNDDENSTKLSLDARPAVAVVVMILAIVLLNVVEGGQAALIGLVHVVPDLYRDSHPMATRICQIAHYGENLDRYVMGRQLMVVVLIFLINLCGAPISQQDGDDGYNNLFNLPSWVLKVFLQFSVAMILIVSMTAQLNSLVNASHCMLDFINNYWSLFSVYIALGLELSGLLHACYLLQYSLSLISGKQIETSREGPRSCLRKMFFWGRVLFSCCILVCAFYVTLSAILEGKTTFYSGTSEAVAIALFFTFLVIAGVLEGMQIAFFAVAKMPRELQERFPMAKRSCLLLFDEANDNVPGFLAGRQVSVTLCFFILARLTTIAPNNTEDGEDNISGVPDHLQGLFETGLPGAIITTIAASILWQLAASAFPMTFLSIPLVPLLLRWCLLLEATGICSGAWVVASLQKRMIGFKYDELYMRAPEERESKAEKFDEEHNASATSEELLSDVEESSSVETMTQLSIIEELTMSEDDFDPMLTRLSIVHVPSASKSRDMECSSSVVSSTSNRYPHQEVVHEEVEHQAAALQETVAHHLETVPRMVQRHPLSVAERQKNLEQIDEFEKQLREQQRIINERLESLRQEREILSHGIV